MKKFTMFNKEFSILTGAKPSEVEMGIQYNTIIEVGENQTLHIK